MMTEYGWFERDGRQPTHDPGLVVACPVCATSLEDRPRTTVSFLVLSRPARSYFFRVHRDCWRRIDEGRRSDIEGALVDAIAVGVQ